MNKYDLNILILAVLFQATVHQCTTLKGEIHGAIGNRLDKWFKEGRASIKKMNRLLGKAEDDIEPLRVIALDIMQSLIALEDKEHFIAYLNQYQQPGEIEQIKEEGR